MRPLLTGGKFRGGKIFPNAADEIRNAPVTGRKTRPLN